MTRWYVTITWDGFPEGGSYGDVVEAETHDDAVATVKALMAESRTGSTDEDEINECIASYGDEWEVIDCFPLDDFIIREIAEGEIKLPKSGHLTRDEMLRAARHSLQFAFNLYKRCNACGEVDAVRNAIKRIDTVRNAIKRIESAT